jgi:hypothetical protein
LLSIASAHVLLASQLGQSAYQVWKFLATVQPIALAGLIVFVYCTVKRVSEGRGRNFSLLIPVFLFVLLGLNVKASTDTYRFTTQIPSMELEAAAKDPITRVPNLLIRLDPYLETMIAPVILNVYDAIYASATYLGPASPDDPRCAISHEQRESDVQIGKRLFVGPAESCK